MRLQIFTMRFANWQTAATREQAGGWHHLLTTDDRPRKSKRGTLGQLSGRCNCWLKVWSWPENVLLLLLLPLLLLRSSSCDRPCFHKRLTSAFYEAAIMQRPDSAGTAHGLDPKGWAEVDLQYRHRSASISRGKHSSKTCTSTTFQQASCVISV